MADAFLDSLTTANRDEAAAVIAEAMGPGVAVADAGPDVAVPAIEAAPALKPGSVNERWPVKTGQDADRDKIKKAVVDTTITELGAFARPNGWADEKTAPPVALRTTRDAPAETTIWRIKATVIGLRMEGDADYHLELKDDSGAQMIAEIPVPKDEYIGINNPLAGAIKAARDATDLQFKGKVQSQSFVRSDITGKLVPAQAVLIRDDTVGVQEVAAPDLQAITQDPDAVGVESFSTSVDPTPAIVTGIGFFDKSHGQAGNAPNYIELHPVLKIEYH